MLQQGGDEEGAVDPGGRRDAGELYQQRRGREVANPPEDGGSAEVRKELQTEMDELSST